MVIQFTELAEEAPVWLHPEIRTLPDITRHWSARTPERPALRAGDLTVTWAELERQSNQLAHALVAAGATHGNVCLIAKNVPEFWVAWFAAGKAGAAFVPLNWRCTSAELAELVADADPRVLLVEAEYADTMATAVERSGAAPLVVGFTASSYGGPGLAPWCATQAVSDPGTEVRGEDTALIAYTSGTTGRPKGVMHRHEAFSFSALSDELEPTIAWSGDDVNLMVMPNFHLAGSWVSLPTLYHGGCVAMVAAFDPAGTVAAIETFAPTTMCLVPAAIQALLGHVAATGGSGLGSLRTLIYAGSPIAAPVIDAAVSTFGCELRQFYGTTETYIISILRPEDHHATAERDVRTSCGASVPLVATRVVGPDDEDVADGEVGQVLVRSPTMMAGYFRQPEETAAAVRDGWYRTGDLGYRTPGGEHVLVDRTKDMVVTGGENVYSVEVERALQQHPAVATVAVIGAPDERWGEAVTAYVVPAPGVETAGLVDELTAHCRELIAAYKVPKAVHLATALPMTPMGKVRKVDLRRAAKEQQ